MQFKFDPNQQFQLDAIQSVTNLFDGQPLNGQQFEIEIKDKNGLFSSVKQANLGFGNQLLLDDTQL